MQKVISAGQEWGTLTWHLIHKRGETMSKIINLEKLRKNKNLDEIAETILTLISAYGLTLDEVASINFYVMKRSLETKHNKQFLKDKLNLNVDQLSPEAILQVQQALLATYYEKIKENN